MCVLHSLITTAAGSKRVQIDRTPAGSVLLLAGPRGISNAIYGGIMTARAMKLGVVGTIVSGRMRDISEHREANYPVFARGIGTTAANAVCYASTIGETVTLKTSIEGVEHESTVHPGDVIVADADGVVCIPLDLAEKVADMVEKLSAVDAACLEAVRNGAEVGPTFKELRGKLKF